MKCWVTSFPLIENVNLSYLACCVARGGRSVPEGAGVRKDAKRPSRSRRQRPAAAEPRAMWGWFRGVAEVWPGSRRRFLRHSRASFWRRIVWYPGFGGFTRFYRIDAVVPRSLMHRRCQMPLAQPWSFSEKLL